MRRDVKYHQPAHRSRVTGECDGILYGLLTIRTNIVPISSRQNTRLQLQWTLATQRHGDILQSLLCNTPFTMISLSGEQPEQRVLAHMLWQPTSGCITIFHNYNCFPKHGGIIRNLTLQNHCGILLLCQNTSIPVYGAWIEICCVLCSKKYSAMSKLL